MTEDRAAAGKDRESSWVERHVWLISQQTHFAYGMLFPLIFHVLFSRPFLGAVVILAVDFVKEVTFDIVVEKEPFFPGGLVDFAVYVVGTAAAGILLFVTDEWSWTLL